MRTRHHYSVAMVMAFAFIAIVVWRNVDQPLDSTRQNAGSQPPPEKQKPGDEPTSSPASTTPSATGPSPAPATSVQIPNPVPPTPSTKRDFENPLAPSSIPPEVSPNAAEDNPVAAPEFGKIFLMLRDFRSSTGENPIGTNAEIMKTLMGDNPRGATFGPPEGMKLSAQGELLDPWGSPYFFHQVSRDVMEIISAGPDKRRGTEDDLISR
jgi:hypothetical protein